MRQTIHEKQSELRGAMAEMDQMRAQTKITLEERLAAVRRAQFEVDQGQARRSAIVEIVGVIEAERGKSGARRCGAASTRGRSVNELAAKVAADAEAAARQRRIDHIKRDLARAEAAVQSLTAVAPIDGNGEHPAELAFRDDDGDAAGVPAGRQDVCRRRRSWSSRTCPSIFLVARVDEDRPRAAAGRADGHHPRRCHCGP